MGILGQMLLSAWALESPFLAWSELSLLLLGFLPIRLLLYEPPAPALDVTHSILNVLSLVPLGVGKELVVPCIFATQREILSMFMCSRALDAQMAWVL